MQTGIDCDGFPSKPPILATAAKSQTQLYLTGDPAEQVGGTIVDINKGCTVTADVDRNGNTTYSAVETTTGGAASTAKCTKGANL